MVAAGRNRSQGAGTSWITIATCVALSVGGSALLRIFDGPDRRLAAPAADPARVAQLERRVGEVEQQLRLLAEHRAQPVEVVRVAEERGLEIDDAWTAYFDEIVARIARLEERVEAGESAEPPAIDANLLLQLAGQNSILGRRADQMGWSNVQVSDPLGGFRVNGDFDGDGDLDVYVPVRPNVFRRADVLRRLASSIAIYDVRDGIDPGADGSPDDGATPAGGD